MNTKRFLALGALCALVGYSAGCSKKETAVEAEPSAEVPAEEAAAADPAKAAEAAPPPAPVAGDLPGATDVRQALARKDYQGAVARVVALKPMVQREQWEKYVELQYEVRNALGEASETDRNAAEALLTLNALNRGR
jgi:hypothetical protein